MRIHAPKNLLSRPGALVALGLTFAAMCSGGAQTAAGAALLATGLCVVLTLATATASATAVLLAAQRHWLSLLAAMAFVTYVLASAWIGAPETTPAFFSAAWHPLWREFGAEQGAISISPYRSVEGLIAYFAPASAFAIGALTIREREDRRAASALLVGFAGALALISLYWLWADSAVQQQRLDARLGSANAAATLFGVLALMIAARLLRIVRRPNTHALQQIPLRLRFMSAVFLAPVTMSVLAVMLGCLLLTGSRAGIAATAAAFVIFALLIWAPWRTGKTRAPRAEVLVSIAIIMAVLFIFGGQIVLGRMLSINQDAGIRQTLFEMHWGIFLERPWLGHGLNTFHELNAHYLTPETWRDAGYVGAAHNIYLQALEEVGIVGLVLFALMVLPPFIRAGWAAASKRPGSEWSAAAFAATALALAHGYVDFGLQVPAIAALVMFCLGAFSGGQPAPGQVADASADEIVAGYKINKTRDTMPAHMAKLTRIARPNER